MAHSDISRIVQSQRDYFAQGETLTYHFRLQQLKKLKQLVLDHENDITQALKKDLNKAPAETIFHEVSIFLKEVDDAIRHLKSWMCPEKKKTPLALWPGHSATYAEPYGTALIIGPWNYPFLLIMQPLVGAISAGNCAILKPSELSEHTQNVLIDLINNNFKSHYLAAISADADAMPAILQEQYDMIFFTGGIRIGKMIMQAAASHLTPVILELGGKSPCIVDDTAKIPYAARRIAWAKSINAGQTCIAPDYLYVHRSQKKALIAELQQTFTQFYGADPAQSASYGRIINDKHFLRLRSYLDKGRIIFGGKTNEKTRYIAPTLIDEISWNDPIMQEEIFGPLLPILTFDHIDEVITAIRKHDKPLSLYLFSQDKQTENRILKTVSFGGGCVNDCLLQVVNQNLPFGGVGKSGMGAYHGKYSFDAFSHRKSIYRKSITFDWKLEYPPYTERKLAWLRRMIRL